MNSRLSIGSILIRAPIVARAASSGAAETVAVCFRERLEAYRCTAGVQTEREMPAHGVFLAKRRAVAEGGPPPSPPAEPPEKKAPSGRPDPVEKTGFSG